MGYLISGFILASSFLTKQTTLFICIPIFIYQIYAFPKLSIFVIGSFILTLITSTLLFDFFSNNWYSYYIFIIPSFHEWLSEQWFNFWMFDIIKPLFIAFSFSVIYLIMGGVFNKKQSAFWVSIFIGFIGGAYFSRLHSGGYDNVLIPAYIIISVAFGLGFNYLFKKAKKYSNSYGTLEILIYLAIITQLLILFYNPITQIPKKTDIEAGNLLLEKLSEVNGEVYLPYHGYLSSLAGKTTYAQIMAIIDLKRTNTIGNSLITQEINEAINNKKFEMIVLDEPFFGEFQTELEENYYYYGSIFQESDLFFPVTGARLRPNYIYYPLN